MSNKNDFFKLYCFGCGALLQNNEPDNIGYVPKRLEPGSHILCQRCFRLQHYGEVTSEVVNPDDYKKILLQAKKEQALIVYVVDLFAFESSLVPSLLEEMRDCRVVVIASKRDIIPSSVKDDKLIKFIKARFYEHSINPIDIIISSAIKNYNIEEIISKFRNYREKRNVYVFGATSVGKSSLINAFFKAYKNESNEVISTSYYPGTTLDVIKVPLKGNTYIYDTPGLLLSNSTLANIDKKLVKYVTPRKEIKPRVYQLNKEQSLIIENIAKIDFIEGNRTNITIFMSNDLTVTRSKLENSSKVFDNMIKNKQFKFIDRKVNSLLDLQAHDITLPEHDCDIVINGLMWLKIKGKGQKMRVYTLKGIEVYIRESKV